MEALAFGLSLCFKPTPPGAWALRIGGGPVLKIEVIGPKVIEDHWSGEGTSGWEAVIDDVPFVAERGRAGDHRFRHGERSVCHLSSDASLLLCAIDVGNPLAWRIVLDSVLFSVALIVGYEALHAGAVATEAGALAISAGSGGGKSTLLAELLKDGFQLLSDDVLSLEARDGEAPLAHPGPPLMTVPAAVDRVPGEPIAALGDERWLAVPTASEPGPLTGLVVLDRAPGLASGMRRVEDPFSVLLASLLRFPRTAERERSRFEIAAAIASHVPVWRLSADPNVTPGKLARLLRAGLDP